MNTPHFAALSCGALCLSLAAPQVLGESAPALLSTDEELLSLSRATGLSVFADATDSVGWDEKKAPMPSRKLRDNWIGAVSLGRGLSALEEGQSVLFWPCPDVTALATRVRAGESVRREPLDPALAVGEGGRPRTSDSPLSPLLLQYLRSRPRSQQGFEIAVSGLPREVKREVVAQAQNLILDPSQMSCSLAWLDDGFWGRTRLYWEGAPPLVGEPRERPLRSGSPASPGGSAFGGRRMLSISGAVPPPAAGGQGLHSSMGVAILDPSQPASREATP